MSLEMVTIHHTPEGSHYIQCCDNPSLNLYCVKGQTEDYLLSNIQVSSLRSHINTRYTHFASYELDPSTN
jgi:hypothetical protein